MSQGESKVQEKNKAQNTEASNKQTRNSSSVASSRLRSFVHRLYDIFNNLSLLVKVGLVMVLCALIIALIVIVLFVQLAKIEEDLYSPYKEYLATIVYVQNKMLVASSKGSLQKQMALYDTKNVLELMLKGGVFTINNENSRFSLRLEPLNKNDAILIKKVLDKVNLALEDNTSIDISSLLDDIRNVAYLFLEKDFETRKLIARHLHKTRTIELILIAVLAVVLLCGGAAFFLMVLSPLKKTTARIHDIACARNIGLSQFNLLNVPFRDEIGKLVEEVNNLIKYFDELGKFKRLLEEDDSLSEVYERLAQLLKERFGFSKFVIYSVSNSQNTMEVVYQQPPDLLINQEILILADLCRAKRTGKIVSSFDTHGICRMFIHEGHEHLCIPLISGGKVEGIIQLIISQGEKERLKEIVDFMPQLQAFLDESLPVIKAKRYAKSLKEMAIKDQLTGLYNRRFVEQVLDNLTAAVLRRGTVLGVLMCDIDFFKKVNDEFGHDVGDEILAGIGKTLKDSVRKSDIVSRFGGEEFLILLLDIHKDEAEIIAEKIRKRIEESVFETKAGSIRKTISIGVSEFPTDAEGIWQVIKFADVALYKAKELGRNRVVRFRSNMWKEGSKLV